MHMMKKLSELSSYQKKNIFSSLILVVTPSTNHRMSFILYLKVPHFLFFYADLTI